MVTRAMIGILCRYLAFYAGLDELAARHDPSEPRQCGLGIGEELARTRRACRSDVALQQAQQTLLFLGLELDERDELVVDEPLVRIEQEAFATRHAGAEVSAVRTEDDDGAARHVLARVVTDALDDSNGPRVADGEALARRAGNVELAARRSVEGGIAHEAR